MQIFSIDKISAVAKSKNLYYAGTLLQGYYCYIALRDLLITINVFFRWRGDSTDAFLTIVLLHYFASCLDNLALTGLTIWSAVALNSESGALFKEAPV